MGNNPEGSNHYSINAGSLPRVHKSLLERGFPRGTRTKTSRICPMYKLPLGPMEWHLYKYLYDIKDIYTDFSFFSEGGITK
jgi:hypothetical protein